MQIEVTSSLGIQLEDAYTMQKLPGSVRPRDVVKRICSDLGAPWGWLAFNLVG